MQLFGLALEDKVQDHRTSTIHRMLSKSNNEPKLRARATWWPAGSNGLTCNSGKTKHRFGPDESG